MSNDLEAARQSLSDFLETLEADSDLSKAIEQVVAARDEEGLELLSDVLEVEPDVDQLEPLWSIVVDGQLANRIRGLALEAACAVLVQARISLEDSSEDDEPLLSPEALASHAKRLMGLHGDTKLNDKLRRLSLETAAILSSEPTVLKAGEAAFGQDDPSWVATGLFVLRILDSDRARELVAECLEHKDLAVRAEAIMGLADLGSDDDLDALADLVFEGAPAERSVALWALVEVPQEKAGEILAEAAKWLDGEGRDEARLANTEWADRWADFFRSSDEKESRSALSRSRRTLDRYLSDDFDFEGGGGGGGDD